MEFKYIILKKEKNIAFLTLNRSEALNSLNKEMLEEIEKSMEIVSQDEEIYVLIITGSGNKAFCAGADIKYAEKLNVLEAREWALLGQRVFNTIENMPKPVIAAINGYALGGGCELAMSCDIRIAAKRSRFSQPEVKIGIMPSFSATHRLPSIVGKGYAKELLYTGEMIDSDKAKEIKLVNHVIEDDNLMNFAKELAGKIAQNGQIGIRLIKSSIDRGFKMDSDKAMIQEADLFAISYATEDKKEGMNAFIEKRKPCFKAK